MLSYMTYSKDSYAFNISDTTIDFLEDYDNIVKTRNSSMVSRDIEKLLQTLGCNYKG